MKTSRVTKFHYLIVWFVVLAVAIFSRFFEITNKPIHFDESINGWFVLQMAKMGYYKYDPTNYHGPFYFYLIQLFEFFWGRSLAVLRYVPATFGVFSVMLFTGSWLRSKAVSWIILLLILSSPAFLFFGRSGIHEMPFVFFQLVWTLGLLRWMEAQDKKALAAMLVGLFGMMVLKETFVLTICSFVFGILCLGPQQWRMQFSWQRLKAAWSQGTTALFAFLLIFFVAFFTGFMRNPAGLVDFVRAFLPWMKTGVGHGGHNKEFLYWLKVMVQAEPLAFLGFLLSFWGLFSKRISLRLMSAFSLSQLLVYSLIPYKTVWCILSLVWGFYFVLALFVEKLWVEKKKLFWVLVILISVLSPLQLYSDYVAVYRQPIHMDHPYVYVNSTYELKNLEKIIADKFQQHPELRSELIQVGMKEQWPWPWVLRFLPGVQWDLCSVKMHAHALIYFCDEADRYLVESGLDTEYIKVIVPMRQSRESSLVYLRKNAFDGSYHGDYEVVGPKGDNP